MFTVNTAQMYQIINSEHRNPHNILGIHKVMFNGKEAVAVRAFIPQAEKMWVYSTDNSNIYCEMDKIDSEGFFEAVIQKDELFSYKLKAKAYNGAEWEYNDPYCFDRVISEFEAYLFNEGKNYEIYKKMGSHPMNINGVEGILFAVWAPNAKRVSVVGDFNEWDGRRNQMRLLGKSGVWELFIPGMCTGDLYKFEIKTIHNLVCQKSDPYGNYAELRPNTASIVYDINKYKWEDKKWLAERKQKNLYNLPMSVYEVHLGSWARNELEGNRFMTYRELAHSLVEYVKDMGYTHIELMPIEEHPFDGSWGYQVTGYFAPTSRYGTPEDFMYFVDYCHKNGIGVILDWVPAHFPKDAHGLAKFDGTALYEHADPRLGEHPDWGTLIFNFGKSEVKNFLISNALYWITQYHIDGLRVDAVASMLYLDYGKKDGQWVRNKFGGNENLEAVEFMRQLNTAVKELDNGSIMIAEESTAWFGVSKPISENGLGYDFKWNMGWMNDFIKYMSMDPLFRKGNHGMMTFSMAYAYSEHFILVLSHDEVVHGKCSMINKMPGLEGDKFASLRTAYGFMFAHPGKKLNFMGNEFAQLREWSEERSLDWFLLKKEEAHKKMQEYFKALNHFYTSEKALWELDDSSDGFKWLDQLDADKSFVAFSRQGKSKKDKLIFVFNFIPVAYKRTLGVDEAGEYVEIFNSDDKKFGGEGRINKYVMKTKRKESNGKKVSFEFELPPLSMLVFKKRVNLNSKK